MSGRARRISLVIAPQQSTDDLSVLLAYLRHGVHTAANPQILKEVIFFEGPNVTPEQTVLVERFLRGKHMPSRRVAINLVPAAGALLPLAAKHTPDGTDIFVIHQLYRLRPTWLDDLDRIFRTYECYPEKRPGIISVADWFVYHRLGDLCFARSTSYKNGYSPASVKFFLDPFYAHGEWDIARQHFEAPTFLPGAMLMPKSLRPMIAGSTAPKDDSLRSAVEYSELLRQRGCAQYFLPSSELALDESAAFDAFEGIFLFGAEGDSKRDKFLQSVPKHSVVDNEIPGLELFARIFRKVHAWDLNVVIAGTDFFKTSTRGKGNILHRRTLAQYPQGFSNIVLLPHYDELGFRLAMYVDGTLIRQMSVAATVALLKTLRKIRDARFYDCTFVSTTGWRLPDLKATYISFLEHGFEPQVVISDYSLLQHSDNKPAWLEYMQAAKDIVFPSLFSFELHRQLLPMLEEHCRIVPPRALPEPRAVQHQENSNSRLAVVCLLETYSEKDIRRFREIADTVGDRFRWIAISKVSHYANHPFIEWRQIDWETSPDLALFAPDLAPGFALLNTSLQETFPYVAYEALDAGLAILTTFENAHVSQLVRETGAGISFNHVVHIAEYLKAEDGALYADFQRLTGREVGLTEREGQCSFPIGIRYLHEFSANRSTNL